MINISCLRWQNNIGNIFFNGVQVWRSPYLSELASITSPLWQNKLKNFLEKKINSGIKPSSVELYGLEFKDLYPGFFEHEASHIWQSRFFNDSFIQLWLIMGQHSRIHVYFITFVVVDWIGVFTTSKYNQVDFGLKY